MDMKSVVLKTINENTKEGKTWGMWLIEYFDGTKPLSVKVVCGEKKTKDSGEIWYVAKGFGVRDFQTLKPHYQELVKLSANMPAFPGETVAPAEDIEETPF